MRGMAVGALAALGLGAMALPAAASGVPPMDLTRGELAVQAGVPSVGADLSLGRLVLGGAATAYVLPTLASGYGVVGHASWRLSGLPRREACWGLALLGGTLTWAGRGATSEYWYAQPALAVAVPLGGSVTLRAAGGPICYLAATTNAGSRGVAQAFLPFLPNAELAFRLTEGHELVLGGLPNVLGWRGTF